MGDYKKWRKTKRHPPFKFYIDLEVLRPSSGTSRNATWLPYDFAWGLSATYWRKH